MKAIDRTKLVCGEDKQLLLLFRGYLNDTYNEISVAGVTFNPADVLQTMDPVAFRLQYDEWVEELGDEVPGGRYECGRCGYRWEDQEDAEGCCDEDDEQ